jgi:hypothetical protein
MSDQRPQASPPRGSVQCAEGQQRVDCHSTTDYSAVGLVELRPDERDGRAKRDALARMDAARVRQAFMHWTELNERGVLG